MKESARTNEEDVSSTISWKQEKYTQFVRKFEV